MKKRSIFSKDLINKLWDSYINFIQDRTRSERIDRSRSEIWKDKFFTEIAKFVLPIGLITLTAAVAIEYADGHYKTVLVDVISFIAIVIVIITKKLKIQAKKIFGMAILVAFSLMKISTLYSLTLGTMYLLVFSIIATLLFNKRAAYLSVLINAVICIAFTIGQMEGFPMHKVNISNSDMSSRWALFTLNIIFVNLVIVVVILSITDGFEKAMEKAERLASKLRQEVSEKAIKEKLLQESSTHYRSLFFFNPFPILIYDPVSLRVINVNKAAIQLYGYSKQEFLEININLVANCTEAEFRDKLNNGNAHQVDSHSTKDGAKIMADIHVNSIKLDGRSVRVAIIRDITAETSYMATIARKNKKMREIAYMQSHVIRNPLSQIMGITELLQDGVMDDDDFQKLLSYLINSAKELDLVVTDVIRQTE